MLGGGFPFTQPEGVLFNPPANPNDYKYKLVPKHSPPSSSPVRSFGYMANWCISQCKTPGFAKSLHSADSRHPQDAHQPKQAICPDSGSLEVGSHFTGDADPERDSPNRRFDCRYSKLDLEFRFVWNGKIYPTWSKTVLVQPVGRDNHPPLPLMKGRDSLSLRHLYFANFR